MATDDPTQCVPSIIQFITLSDIPGFSHRKSIKDRQVATAKHSASLRGVERSSSTRMSTNGFSKNMPICFTTSILMLRQKTLAVSFLGSRKKLDT